MPVRSRRRSPVLFFGLFMIVTGLAVGIQGSLVAILLGSFLSMLGFFVIVLGFGRNPKSLFRAVFGDRWLFFVLTLVPTLLIFVEVNLLQGGPFGTIKIGGIVLEHEGFGIGMFSASTFFPNSRLKFFIIGTGFALVASEAYLNGLVDFQNNPFGIFFSVLLGFIITYAFMRAIGRKERRGAGSTGEIIVGAIG